MIQAPLILASIHIGKSLMMFDLQNVANVMCDFIYFVFF